MKMQKSFLAMCAISSLMIVTQAYSDTVVNFQNTTSYCGLVLIQYGPAAHPTWNVRNLPFVSNATYQIGHINDTNNFPNYVLGRVQLQSIPTCKGTHFTAPLNCTLTIKLLSDSFTVHVSTESKSKLVCTVD